jgi:L-arabinose transport system substrate-binding protein
MKMTKSRVAAGLFATLCGSSLLASGMLAEAKEKLVVAIYKSGTQQYFIDQGNGFTKAAEALGYKAKVINVELDANLAVSAIADAIASGAAGIGLTAPDQAMGPAAAKAAADAKIPMVATDDSLKDADGKAVAFVGFDGTDMGNKVGQKAAELFTAAKWKEGGKYIVLSTEVQTLSVCNDRTNAAKAQMKAAGADKIVTVAYDGTTNAALEAAGPVITANPGVENYVVFACNDEGALGTLNALTTAGVKPDNIIAVGLGAYEACRPWKAGTPTGFKAALYLSGVDVGDAAARALIENIEKGTPIPEKTVAKTTIVDPSNYKDVMPCG